MRRANNLTTFLCQFSRNSGASTSRNPKGLSRPAAGKLLWLWHKKQSCVNIFESWCPQGFRLNLPWLSGQLTSNWPSNRENMLLTTPSPPLPSRFQPDSNTQDPATSSAQKRLVAAARQTSYCVAQIRLNTFDTCISGAFLTLYYTVMPTVFF